MPRKLLGEHDRTRRGFVFRLLLGFQNRRGLYKPALTIPIELHLQTRLGCGVVEEPELTLCARLVAAEHDPPKAHELDELPCLLEASLHRLTLAITPLPS